MKGLTIITEWYPIGSIYISVNTTNPGDIFGGTWEQIKDKFILCSGDIYSNGSMGGSATHLHETQGHTLTIAEIPSHTHPLSYRTGGGGGGTTWYTDPGTADGFNTSASTAIGNTGGGAAHNHGSTTSASTLPPYLAVTVWKRIA